MPVIILVILINEKSVIRYQHRQSQGPMLNPQ